MGIKIAKLDLKKSLEDDKVTLERIAIATKWDREMVSVWEKNGRDACGNLIEEAEAAFKKKLRRGRQLTLDCEFWRSEGTSWLC